MINMGMMWRNMLYALAVYVTASLAGVVMLAILCVIRRDGILWTLDSLLEYLEQHGHAGHYIGGIVGLGMMFVLNGTRRGMPLWYWRGAALAGLIGHVAIVF